jgi:hypothetical protein
MKNLLRNAVLVSALVLPGNEGVQQASAQEVEQQQADTKENVQNVFMPRQVKIDSVKIVSFSSEKFPAIDIRCIIRNDIDVRATIEIEGRFNFDMNILKMQPPAQDRENQPQLFHNAATKGETQNFKFFPYQPNTNYSVQIYLVPENKEAAAQLPAILKEMEDKGTPITVFELPLEQEKDADEEEKNTEK